MTYEETLSALHGLIGQNIAMAVLAREDGRDRIVAYAAGRLALGRTIDVGELVPGAGEQFRGGDSVAFVIGERGPDPTALSGFFVAAEDFVTGAVASEDPYSLSFIMAGVIVEISAAAAPVA